ncbi:Meiosis 1 arrest protein, partial [Camelus dromedarius]
TKVKLVYVRLFRKESGCVAKGEPPSRGHSLREAASTFYVIAPSCSAILLVRAVATRRAAAAALSPCAEDLPVKASGLWQARSRDTVPGARVFSAPNHLELLLFLSVLRPGARNPPTPLAGLEPPTHLSSTFAKPQGQLTQAGRAGAEKDKALLASLQAGQLQINRVRARVAPLPMTPAPGRDPKMPAASKASSAASSHFHGGEEEMEEEECPPGPKPPAKSPAALLNHIHAKAHIMAFCGFLPTGPVSS